MTDEEHQTAEETATREDRLFSDLSPTPRITDATGHYGVERRARHAERPGFRISELQISPVQTVPWHSHSDVRDTFYVLEGAIRIVLREPDEEVRLGRGETVTVPARRPHLVANAGETSATFLVLQLGAYDYVPIA